VCNARGTGPYLRTRVLRSVAEVIYKACRALTKRRSAAVRCETFESAPRRRRQKSKSSSEIASSRCPTSLP